MDAFAHVFLASRKQHRPLGSWCGLSLPPLTQFSSRALWEVCDLLHSPRLAGQHSVCCLQETLSVMGQWGQNTHGSSFTLNEVASRVNLNWQRPAPGLTYPRESLELHHWCPGRYFGSTKAQAWAESGIEFKGAKEREVYVKREYLVKVKQVVLIGYIVPSSERKRNIKLIENLCGY